MPTTARGYRYPALSAAPNVPADLGNLAADIDADVTASAPGAWTAYTPIWKGQTTDPVIGNGTLTCRYQKLGPKTVMYVGMLVMGSTTTYGSGAWLMTLPISARVPGGPLPLTPGSAWLYDNSTTANRTSGIAMLFGTADLYFAAPNVSSVNATAPFTWANLDQLHWSFIYETA